MSSVVYLNGEFLAADQAKVSIFDRGFMFADSLYEVIPFYNGIGFRWTEHLARLSKGLHAAHINLDLDLEPLCQQLIARNGGGHQAVYIQITRGADTLRRHRISSDLIPTVLLLSYPIQPALSGDLTEIEGISVITTEDIRWGRCDIKSTALMANILALQEAIGQGAQEAIFVRDGFLLEGTASNLFLVKEGCILTTPEDPHILGGTTRSLVVELARKLAIPLQEQPLPASLLAEVDEAWITGSTKGVLPVIRINAKLIGTGQPGPLWGKMAQAFRNYQRELLKI